MLNEFRSTLITWDKATSRIYSPVTANASDENGRKLVVQIVNGGQVEDLTGATLHLYWETRDKAHDGLDVFKAVDLKKGEFELSYTTGMLSNQGVLNANLVLIDTVGRVVSERFKITVTEGIDNDAIQSENSFSSLTQALIDVSNLEQNYTPRLNDLTAQLQQIALDVTKCGAKGDGVTDDTLAIQQALDTASTVLIPKGTYMIDTTRLTIENYGDNTVGGLFPNSNQTIIFEHGARLKAIPTSAEWYSVLAFHEVENVTVINGTVIGEKNEHIGVSGEWGYGFNIMSSKNILLQNCTANDFWGDGFLVGCTNHTDASTKSRYVTLKNCVGRRNRRQGASVVGCDDFKIIGCEFTDTLGTEPCAGIDIEPNHPNTKPERGVLRDNVLNRNYFGLMITQASDITVDNCSSKDNRRSALYITGNVQLEVFNCRFYDMSVLRMTANPGARRTITIRHCVIHIGTGAELMVGEGVGPFFSGEVNLIENTINVSGNPKTLKFFGGSIDDEISTFNGNKINIDKNLGTTGLLFGSAIYYVDGKPQRTQTSGNTFTYLGANELHLQAGNGNSHYGLKNTFIGNIYDFSGKVNGDVDNLLFAPGNVPANSMTTQTNTQPGVQVGDIVTLTPLSALTGFIYTAYATATNTLTLTCYNMTGDDKWLEHNFALKITRG